MILSENISIADARGIITAFGVTMSGEFLYSLSTPTPDGIWFRIVAKEGGGSQIEMHDLSRKPLENN